MRCTKIILTQIHSCVVIVVYWSALCRRLLKSLTQIMVHKCCVDFSCSINNNTFLQVKQEIELAFSVRRARVDVSVCIWCSHTSLCNCQLINRPAACVCVCNSLQVRTVASLHLFPRLPRKSTADRLWFFIFKALLSIVPSQILHPPPNPHPRAPLQNAPFILLMLPKYQTSVPGRAFEVQLFKLDWSFNLALSLNPAPPHNPTTYTSHSHTCAGRSGVTFCEADVQRWAKNSRGRKCHASRTVWKCAEWPS